MNLETDFKQVTGEDILLVNDEITALRGVHYSVNWDKVADIFRYALPEVTSEDIKRVIDNNPALTEQPDPCEGCDGYKTSDCCGAWTDTDILICSDCKEHCGVQCDECEDKKE
jgi:hypothetical protein